MKLLKKLKYYYYRRIMKRINSDLNDYPYTGGNPVSSFIHSMEASLRIISMRVFLLEDSPEFFVESINVIKKVQADLVSNLKKLHPFLKWYNIPMDSWEYELGIKQKSNDILPWDKIKSFTFNTERDIRKHNEQCYNSIDKNTNLYFGKEPEKMICTLENCICRCHK